ncbi:septum site-determining protein MinC [Thermincola potens]|uniref:Probable septum site-determining protein MinC n=1 Tax=Thermincola potens (strain JR) TaxID=635013 RepID=D5XEX9_THEPJ|nr:septum site-determining protein MinC [Thermincola potens]ADG82200.1 septum site-determining protein MinC [Thermincola potens JR]
MKKESVNIKGTINGLVICIDPETELGTIKADLEAKILASPGFFKNAKFKIFAGERYDPSIFSELEQLCCSHGMIHAPAIPWPPETNNVSNQVRAALQESAAGLHSRGFQTTDSPLPANRNSALLEDTLLIHRNLRSGQKLHYHGNLVVLGDVNPGAEICAGGDIIVMGVLRGIAHAGAAGNENAIILAYRLEPTQLRIADKITRPPEKDTRATQPELARLSGNQMIIEPYRSQKNYWEVIA